MKPKLSIIVPCYNYGHYLPTCVDSILAQDYTDYELLLVDDGSSDKTWPIMQEYANKHTHIQAIKHPHNKGIFEANKTGWDASSGEYLHFFSSDDTYRPTCLSKVMKVFEENPSLSLVCTDINYLHEQENCVRTNQLLPNCHQPRVYTKYEMISLFQTTRFWVPGLTCIVKNKTLHKYGHLDPKLENISDWFCFHKIALFEGVGYIPEPLIEMRLHDRTYTSIVKRDKKRRRATYKHLLSTLSKNSETCEKFVTAGLLSFVFRELKWQLRLNPAYFAFRKWMH